TGMLVASVGLVMGMAVLPRLVVVIVHVHVHLGRAEHALHHLTPLQGEAGQSELGELATERLEGHAVVDEGAHHHIPRRAARAVEVGEAHGQRVSTEYWRLCPSFREVPGTSGSCLRAC